MALALRGLLDETSRVELHRLDGVRRDPDNVARVMRSLARNSATQTSARAIAAEVSGSEEAIDHHTVLSYVAAIEADPTRLLRAIETVGLLFESLVVRDLRVYAPNLGANVYHYRDNTGSEVDANVQRRRGAWAAFEVKLGHRAIDAAAACLLRLAERVDIERHGQPVALGVMTGWGYAYRRRDGVDVITIGTLAP